nr:hypothetical protein Iba_chr08dCG1040 [Ipomoea batatas]
MLPDPPTEAKAAGVPAASAAVISEESPISTEAIPTTTPEATRAAVTVGLGAGTIHPTELAWPAPGTNSPHFDQSGNTKSQGAILASVNGLKLIHIELLVNNPNLKIYTIGRRQVNPNLVHVEPEPESLHLNPVQVGDGSDA